MIDSENSSAGYLPCSLVQLEREGIFMHSAAKQQMVGVLDALASYVTKMLTDMARDKVAMLLGVTGKIDDLSVKLRDLKNFLADADRRIITDESVREWVEELKRAMYLATDILDLCQLKAMETCPSKNSNLERVREIVACAEGLGVPRGSLMFRHALHTVPSLSQERIAAKMGFLKKTFRWSDAEVAIVVSRAPSVLTKSEDVLQAKSDFLVSEVGLEPANIAHRPVILNLSLEGRLKPRYYVVNFLKAKRLLDRDWSHYTIFKVTEKEFVEKIICPHKEAAPHLAEDYAAARRGQIPTRFIFS